MRMAIDEARKALNEEEVPIGAVAVCGDRVVGRGHNLVETLCDATAHAEMQSITAAASTLGGKYLKGCTLYVTVEPCVMCAGAFGVEPDRPRGLRRGRPEARLHHRRRADIPPQDRGHGRRFGRGVRGVDEGVLQRIALGVRLVCGFSGARRKFAE